jgi:hypothetical protein
VAIDKFVKTGGTFKQFQLKFRLRSINTWCWSRHKAHVTDTIVESAPSPSPENTLLDVKKLGDINKRLQILAQRSEKGGRPANAIQAYSQLAKNLTTLAEYAKEQNKLTAGAAPRPIFNICFKESPNSIREEAPKRDLDQEIQAAIDADGITREQWDALQTQFAELHDNVTVEEWKDGESFFRVQSEEILNGFRPRTRALFLHDFLRKFIERNLGALVFYACRKYAEDLQRHRAGSEGQQRLALPSTRSRMPTKNSARMDSAQSLSG